VNVVKVVSRYINKSCMAHPEVIKSVAAFVLSLSKTLPVREQNRIAFVIETAGELLRANL
jgi:hypothetical protein